MQRVSIKSFYPLTQTMSMRILNRVFLVVALCAVLVLPAFVGIANAQTTTEPPVVVDDPFGTSQIDTVFTDAGTLTSQDVRTTVSNIINVALGLLGIIAVVIILIGGFTWMTAGGNDEKVGEAKNLIMAGVIGLIIIFAAWSIARFVISSLQTATGPAVEWTVDQLSRRKFSFVTNLFGHQPVLAP